jgi:hypothetical protein
MQVGKQAKTNVPMEIQQSEKVLQKSSSYLRFKAFD